MAVKHPYKAKTHKKLNTLKGTRTQKIPTYKQSQKSLQKQYTKPLPKTGFTLTEVLITTVIIGILSSIAFPNYHNQVNRTRQREAASTISQIQTTIASYADEFGVLPTSWNELNETKENFQSITLAGGYYDVVISNTDNLFTITATRDEAPNLNIVACVNLTNGASGINQGTKAAAASAPNCG